MGASRGSYTKGMNYIMRSIARPFGILLMFLYDLVSNYGLALILFAVVVRVILLPFQMKGKLGMMKQSRLQPKLAELQKKHGTNKAKINEETAKLYKEEGVNPASGCLWSFLPMPIMLALFLAIREPLTMVMGVAAELLDLEGGGAIAVALQKLAETHGLESTVSAYYVQVEQAQWISSYWDSFKQFADQGLRSLDFNFGIINLGAQPQWNFLWSTDWGNIDVWLPGLALFMIPLLSAGSQFAATIINRKINPVATPEGQGGSMQAMLMLMPLMSLYFAFITPAALGFYWTTGTVLQILQDIVLTKRYSKKLDAEDAIKNEERKKKEAEIEAKRLETERKKAEGFIERNPNTSKRRKHKSEKQEQLEKAAEWEKKHAPPEEETYEPSRVGNRRHARGRSYDPDRYAGTGGGKGSDSYDSSDDERVDPESAGGGNDAVKYISSGDEEPDSDYEDEPDDDGDFDDDDDDGDYDEDDDDDDGDYDDDEDNGGTPPTIRFDTKRFDSDKEE